MTGLGLRRSLGQLKGMGRLGPTPQGKGGGVVPPAPLVWPGQGARYDLDFAANLYHGGTQPDDTTNANDGRFFRQMITPSFPVFAENADGSLRRWASGTAVLRRTSRGLLVEPEVNTGEQPILWTNDLTNAAWIKTNATAAKNQTGREGVANYASLLTATADGGTALYPVTLATSTRNFYADLKRVAGVGTVELTLDGGATWVPITLDQPRFNGWGRYGIPRTSVTNPSFGIRLGTSGDQVAVAYATSDLSAYELSPWDMSGTARRRRFDRPSSSITGGTTTSVSSGMIDYIRANSNWGLYIEWDSLYTDHFLFGQVLRPTSTGAMVFTTDDNVSGDNRRVRSDDGLVFVTTNRNEPVKNRAYAYVQDGVCKLCVNGSAVYSGGTLGGAYTALDHKDLGSNGSGTVNMAGYISRFAVLDAPWTDAEAILRTAPDGLEMSIMGQMLDGSGSYSGEELIVSGQEVS